MYTIIHSLPFTLLFSLYLFAADSSQVHKNYSFEIGGNLSLTTERYVWFVEPGVSLYSRYHFSTEKPLRQFAGVGLEVIPVADLVFIPKVEYGVRLSQKSKRWQPSVSTTLGLSVLYTPIESKLLALETSLRLDLLSFKTHKGNHLSAFISEGLIPIDLTGYDGDFLISYKLTLIEYAVCF